MKKLMTMVGAVGLAFAATAGIDDALLAFSTVGPDKYADGTDVLAGECYALVWSADGQFDGLKADGTTVDPADKVVLVAPVAKQGETGTYCPSILYQVDQAFADAHKNGQYAVYILDTRVKAADGTWAVGGVDENGALKTVNGYDAVSEGTTAASDSRKTVATTATGGASVATFAQVDAPVITAIKPNGAKITISTSGLSPVVNYKVVTGTELDKVSTEISATADEKGDFTFDKPENGKFFKVIGVRKIEEK